MIRIHHFNTAWWGETAGIVDDAGNAVAAHAVEADEQVDAVLHRRDFRIGQPVRTPRVPLSVPEPLSHIYTVLCTEQWARRLPCMGGI